MSLNLKQLEYVVLAEDMLDHTKNLGTLMKIGSVLIDRPIVLSCVQMTFLAVSAVLWNAYVLQAK